MFSLPNQPKVIKKEGSQSTFEIEGLYPGYGVTVGNSLRRVLFSSLEGWAITQVKIKGVPHDFTTIPGVLEDVIMLTLNLKQLRFRVMGDEPQKAFLKVKGEKEVKGSDFDLPSQMELMNKNAHIATLTKKASELEMEVLVEKGIGYVSRDAQQKRKMEIGAISLDAIFSPVKRVTYKVENMRVGERTDYDRLFIEVKTDGVISPEQAMSKAAQILVDHFSMIAETLKEEEKPVKEKKETVKKKKPVKKNEKKKKGKKI
jgi:DNA-directed RNA polymerase subunit alpha